MTCIIAVKDHKKQIIHMMGDKMVAGSNSLSPGFAGAVKVFKFENLIVGYSGWAGLSFFLNKSQKLLNCDPKMSLRLKL